MIIITTKTGKKEINADVNKCFFIKKALIAGCIPDQSA
jgi:hypothetical protein